MQPSTLPLLLLALPLLCFAQTQDITGDWKGTLAAGGAELHLALHITKSADGKLSGTLDSLDQGANGIALSEVSLKDSKIAFNVDPVHGSYSGQVNADGSAMSGSWTQGQSMPLDFKRSVPDKPAAPSDIDGAWLGTLDTGAMKLRLVFHIKNTGDGLTATADSPDQNAKGIPVTAITRSGSSLKIEMKQLSGVFEGVINKDLDSIQGTWTQGGGSLPLLLKRVKDAASLDKRRPQNPVKPYPYREEEVTYKNPVAGIELAATLTTPRGKGQFPAVVLITGSGPQDRDEALMGHKPFLVLADYLTRRGIAVLRADDRGVAKSGGNFATATSADFATDTEAGLAYLKTRPEIDTHRLGLIGHSEGGMIAPMIAARTSEVAFIVMLAGPGVPGEQILLAQQRLILQASGMSEVEIDKKVALNTTIFELIRTEKDPAALDKQLHAKLSTELPEAQLGQQMKSLNSPWFRYFLTYDPAVALEKVSCPVLALSGEKDLQVPPSQNIPAIKRALDRGGNKLFEVDELPSLNHLFQTAKTGSPAEYGQIEETFSLVALEKIATWIDSLPRPDSKS